MEVITERLLHTERNIKSPLERAMATKQLSRGPSATIAAHSEVLLKTSKRKLI